VLWTICPVCHRTTILPIPASQVARITGVSHWRPARSWLLRISEQQDKRTWCPWYCRAAAQVCTASSQTVTWKTQINCHLVEVTALFGSLLQSPYLFPPVWVYVWNTLKNCRFEEHGHLNFWFIPPN
jgi:hypothetical protein